MTDGNLIQETGYRTFLAAEAALWSTNKKSHIHLKVRGEVPKFKISEDHCQFN